MATVIVVVVVTVCTCMTTALEAGVEKSIPVYDTGTHSSLAGGELVLCLVASGDPVASSDLLLLPIFLCVRSGGWW